MKGCHAAIFSRWKWFFKEGNERHLLLWNLRKLINRPLWRSLQRVNKWGLETGQLPWVLTQAFQWHSCPPFTQTPVSSSWHMLLYLTPANSSFLQGRRMQSFILWISFLYLGEQAFVHIFPGKVIQPICSLFFFLNKIRKRNNNEYKFSIQKHTQHKA